LHPPPEGHEVNASSGCRDDLDGVKSAAEAARQAESDRDDFEQCQRDPDTYDHRGDSCRSLRSDYDSAADKLEGQMDDLDSKIDDVQISCHYPFSVNRLSPIQASERRLADAIKDSAGPTNRPIPE
jgi:hypothetical protein